MLTNLRAWLADHLDPTRPAPALVAPAEPSASGCDATTCRCDCASQPIWAGRETTNFYRVTRYRNMWQVMQWSTGIWLSGNLYWTWREAYDGARSLAIREARR